VVMSPSNALSANILPEEIVSHKVKKVAPGAQGIAPGATKGTADDYHEIRLATERFCETTDDLIKAREELSHLIEETIIRKALAKKINQRDLAQQLGMSRTTLRKKMHLYGITS